MDRATASQGGSSKGKDPTAGGTEGGHRAWASWVRAKSAGEEQAGRWQSLGVLQVMGEGMVFIFRVLGSLWVELNKRETWSGICFKKTPQLWKKTVRRGDKRWSRETRGEVHGVLLVESMWPWMWMGMEDSAVAVGLSGWSLCLRWRGWRDDHLRWGAGRALLLTGDSRWLGHRGAETSEQGSMWV